MTTRRKAAMAVGAVGAGLVARKAMRSDQVRFARMGGSTIAAPDAAGWVTDFLNAAYYAREPDVRDVDDLRLAFAILTTRWHRNGHRRLHAPDVIAFHKAFFGRRLALGRRAQRGALDRDQLLEGAVALLGGWFPEAYADDARRGWGIAFETVQERDAYDPAVRQRHARLGEPSPPSLPDAEQVWHTYAPVPVQSVERVVGALTRPETWPDYATEVGRFTPLRAGGLAGQTFEIEVAAKLAERAPIFTRGYVTITQLVTHEDPAAIGAYVEQLNDGMARIGRDEEQPVPDGATPLVAFDLTTHEGHFMGRSKNRLLLYEDGGTAYLRAAGTWDDMPFHVEQAYRRAGREAQHAFWGAGRPEESMLHQIALRTAPAAEAAT